MDGTKLWNCFLRKCTDVDIGSSRGGLSWTYLVSAHPESILLLFVKVPLLRFAALPGSIVGSHSGAISLGALFFFLPSHSGQNFQYNFEQKCKNEHSCLISYLKGQAFILSFIEYDVVQSFSCVQFCDPMDCSTSGFPVLHHLPERAQTHVHQVSDAIQPPHPLSSPSPPDVNLSQHQGLFQWVGSSHQVAKVLEFQHKSFQWIFRTDFLWDVKGVWC